MKLTIKGIIQPFTITAQPFDGVIDLKRTIQSLKDIAVNQLRLFFWGKELDDDQTLGDCGIHNDSTLHLAVRVFHCIKIFVKVKDKLTTVSVPSSDPARSIKLIMQGSDGYPVPLQRLFFEGAELDDGRALVSHSIRNGSVVDLRVHESPQMQIQVKTLGGKRAMLHVKRSDTIRTVKTMIQDRWGYDLDSISLIHAGKALDNNQPLQTLADYEVQDGDTIHLVFRFPGGAATIS